MRKKKKQNKTNKPTKRAPKSPEPQIGKEVAQASGNPTVDNTSNSELDKTSAGANSGTIGIPVQQPESIHGNEPMVSTSNNQTEKAYFIVKSRDFFKKHPKLSLVGLFIIICVSLQLKRPETVSFAFLVLLTAVAITIVCVFYQVSTDSNYKRYLFKEDSGLSFMVKGVLVPLFVGLIALMVSENINPKKIPVTIVLGGAYSDYQAAYKAEFKDDFLAPAIQSLGDYERTLALDVIEVGPYDQILADVTTGKADLGTLPPYAYIFYNWYFGENGKNANDTNNPLNKLQIIGYKNTSQRGNFYKAGLLFSKAKNDSLAGKSSTEVIATVKAQKGKVYYSNEPLSTSGNHIAKTWLLSQGYADLWLTGRRVASSEMLEALCPTTCNDTCSCSDGANRVGFYSSDQWDILKRYNPKEAKKFNWVPILEFPIPYEPILVNKEEWNDKFDSGWQRLWDMLTLRKLDFRKSRKDVILESLHSFMTPIENESEWLINNQDFADVLRAGVPDSIDTFDNQIHIWFPVSEDSDGRQLWYDSTALKKSIFCFHQLDKNLEHDRFDKNRTLNYPKILTKDSCIELDFKTISETSTIDKGMLRYEFSFDDSYRAQICKYSQNTWYVLPKDSTKWARWPIR